MKSLQDKYILRNGVEVPCIGFGTWKMPDEVAENAVKAAIEATVISTPQALTGTKKAAATE